MKLTLGPEDYQALQAAAAASPRRRAHLELHAGGADDPLQRFVVGILPGSYVRAHRHVEAHKLEVTACLAGGCDVLFFEARGAVTARHPLRADGGGLSLLQIPPGTWHSLSVPEGFAVLLEVKQGPYNASTDKDFAAWAPREGEAGSANCAAWLRSAQVGERWSG